MHIRLRTYSNFAKIIWQFKQKLLLVKWCWWNSERYLAGNKHVYTFRDQTTKSGNNLYVNSTTHLNATAANFGSSGSALKSSSKKNADGKVKYPDVTTVIHPPGYTRPRSTGTVNLIYILVILFIYSFNILFFLFFHSFILLLKYVYNICAVFRKCLLSKALEYSGLIFIRSPFIWLTTCYYVNHFSSSIHF